MRSRRFGRMPNHRKAMMKNLVTALFQHERITTTLAKAKEMRPYVERLVHKAKADTAQTPIILHRDIKNQVAINNLVNVIAPRFASLPGGFTRIQHIANRRNDKAKAAVIELIGNPQSEFEKNEEAVEKAAKEVKTFWQWELGLLEQEELYWEN